jgi:hypothetical protein
MEALPAVFQQNHRPLATPTLWGGTAELSALPETEICAKGRPLKKQPGVNLNLSVPAHPVRLPPGESTMGDQE